MGVRKIVHIDEEKCTGCGKCIIDCHEMALQIVDGKAKIVKDIYCDGLGDCLKSCPEDAITIIEREAEDYNDEAVKIRIKQHNKKKEALNKKPIAACPSSRNMVFSESDTNLTQWPVQLKLLNPEAPYFKNADLLVTADCVPFAYKNYHEDFLKGKKVGVGCPKLDNILEYEEKFIDIIKYNDLNSITVLRMEVPCCSSLAGAVISARDKAESGLKVEVVTITTNGKILGKEVL